MICNYVFVACNKNNKRCINPYPAYVENMVSSYRGADKSLSWTVRKQARKYVRDARDFNNIETPAVIKFPFLQGKAPKEIHAILTETLACFLPGRAKDLSAPVVIMPVNGRWDLTRNLKG